MPIWSYLTIFVLLAQSQFEYLIYWLLEQPYIGAGAISDLRFRSKAPALKLRISDAKSTFSLIFFTAFDS